MTHAPTRRDSKSKSKTRSKSESESEFKLKPKAWWQKTHPHAVPSVFRNPRWTGGGGASGGAVSLRAPPSPGSGYTRGGGGGGGADEGWEVSYLRAVYPGARGGFRASELYRLECLYTWLLPADVRAELAVSPGVYTATLAGPSCGELPCPCVEAASAVSGASGPGPAPAVSFARDPMLGQGWPPCNVSGPDGPACCASVPAYQACYRAGLVPWAANDTWTGNELNAGQSPPELGVLWKPSLWPEWTLAVNLYPARAWNSFYNAGGDPSDAWVEVVHSSFSISNATYGVWFYRSLGSGMFVNLGRSLSALNKLDALVKLGFGFTALAEFILRPVRGALLDAGVTPASTGLGGTAGLDYWLAGQTHTNLGRVLGPDAATIAEYLRVAAYGTDYNLNRICTTGVLDRLITYLLRAAGYYSVQFTVQANLYNGFTTEIMVVGTAPAPIFTAIHDVPVRVLDPRAPEASAAGGTAAGGTAAGGTAAAADATACTYSYPFACLHCAQAPATMNAGSNCTVDISTFSACPPSPTPHSGPTYG